MVDLITPLVILSIVLLVMLRHISAGIAIIALLAGVMLDQLVASSVISVLPKQETGIQLYVQVVVHLLITFAPMAVVLTVVKANKKTIVISLLSSLLLGFLVVYFALGVLEPIPALTAEIRKSGLFSFVRPYQVTIIAVAAILALVALVVDHKNPSTKK